MQNATQNATWMTWQLLTALRVCPQQYLFRARGPQVVQASGASVHPGARRSQRGELWAEVAASFVADFYQQALWRAADGRAAAADLAGAKLRDQIARARAGFWVLDPWDPQALEAEASTARLAGAGFFDTFQQVGLVGTRIEPRRVCSARLRPDSEVVLVSRPHLYLAREDGEEWLLAPSFRREAWEPSRGRYVFPAEERDAVLWDALVSYLSTAKIPARVGILPLRQPAGYAWDREKGQIRESLQHHAMTAKTAGEKQAALDWLGRRPPATGVFWERCGADNLSALAARCEEAAGLLGRGYPARVGGWCSRCDFEGCCGARISSLRAKRAARGGPLGSRGGKIIRLGE